eukprot:1856139-Pyramimonas_sp.AAC.1
MAQAESPFAEQTIVLPPSCPSSLFLRPLGLHSPPLSVTPLFKGFTNRTWQGMSVPPKRGCDRKRRGRVSRVWDVHIG